MHLGKQKTTSRLNDDLPVGSNALWMIENVDPSMGGPMEFNMPYRLKHIATQRYFAVVSSDPLSDGDRQVTLQMTKKGQSSETLFEFLPWDHGRRYVAQNTGSYFLIKHVQTGYHIHFVSESNPSVVRRVGMPLPGPVPALGEAFAG